MPAPRGAATQLPHLLACWKSLEFSRQKWKLLSRGACSNYASSSSENRVDGVGTFLKPESDQKAFFSRSLFWMLAFGASSATAMWRSETSTSAKNENKSRKSSSIVAWSPYGSLRRSKRLNGTMFFNWPLTSFCAQCASTQNDRPPAMEMHAFSSTLEKQDFARLKKKSPDYDMAFQAIPKDPKGCFAEWNDTLSNLKVFSGTSNPDLAREICAQLGIPLGRARIGRFADGEVTLELLDEVRGQDVFVIQSAPCASTDSSPNSSLMELFFMISAARRASAKTVTAILPYASYFRQPTQSAEGTSSPLVGADIGRLLVAMGADRIVFVDVHTKRVEGLIPGPLPITNLQPHNLSIEYLRRKKDLSRRVVVVSTDNTSVERAEAFMSRMSQAGFDVSMASIVSSRPERKQRDNGAAIVVDPQSAIGVVASDSGAAKYPFEERDQKNGTGTSDMTQIQSWLVNDVAGQDCVIVDDIIDTGERAINTANALKFAGARSIYMVATHGVFSRGALDRIAKSPIKEVVIMDTIRLPENLYCEKLRIISVSKLLAETIRCVHSKLPLSQLHRDVNFDVAMEKEQYTQ